MKLDLQSPISRRGFLKRSITGAAVLTASPQIFVPKASASMEEGVCPHPNVDGLRVVEACDPAMTRESLPVCPWAKQEELVVGRAVEDNLDRMAMALTGERRIQDAWKAIFVKPPAKGWGDVVVAVKTNNIALQHTRSAVMAGICRVLVQQMNVRANHILIYDGKHGGDMAEKTPFSGLPEGCRIVGRWGGIEAPVPIPSPWRGGDGKADCLTQLAEGQVDILINIALCKGHSDKFGGFTMSMKNHLGTFDPKWAHLPGSTDYLLAINKAPQVVGNMDPRSGKVLFPRQQLCVIDALWASEKGPGCETSCQPNRLFMGTFAPVLDYQVATHFRKGTMGWSLDQEVTARFLSGFGFRSGDLPNGGKMLQAAEPVVGS
jgi:hypothetical protein